ncbi:MAG: GntR family transcriptional regulator [Anaerolineales bacterium]|jgi:GntR family transcriptional regulator
MSEYTNRTIKLHEQLKELILKTDAGEKLPSEPKLAKSLGVSRATLREAMRTFETEGLIRRQQGVGTFVVHPLQVIDTGLEVLESIETMAKRLGLNVSMGALQIERRIANEIEGKHLQLNSPVEVVVFTRVIHVEDRPVAYLVDILPSEFLSADELNGHFSGSILDLLLKRGEPKLANSRTDIQAVAANNQVARAMGIQRGDVLLKFMATLVSTTGQIVDYSLSYFLPGTFRFHVVRRVAQFQVSGGIEEA